MSETNDEVKNEQAIDKAIDNVPEKADEIFRDKPENAEGGLKEEAELKPETEEEAKIQKETKVVEDEAIDERDEIKIEAEPLYQKKVYIVDLNNIGLKIEGEGELIVDVMEIKDDKVTVKNGDMTMEVPKDFLF